MTSNSAQPARPARHVAAVGDSDRPAGSLSALLRLRECLVGSTLPLATPDLTDGRAERDSVIGQLDDYVIPRLVQIDAPLLAVVGGSTGAGKSTLLNSLVGRVVSEAGVLRPTTRSAVLVHSPADTHWFGADRLLPDLERTSRVTTDPAALQLLAVDSIPSGLALLDAPDVDSVEKRNRVLARQLLGSADLWLFVTSAARYADQVPWDYLRAAADRSTAVAVVLDRTGAAAVPEVSAHLSEMLTARGLGSALLFTVTESVLSADGLLPPAEVAPIRDWLDGLAADASARRAVIRRTLNGAIASLPARVARVADALDSQEEVADRLRADMMSAYSDSLSAVDEATQDGSMLHGEVLTRWQEFVGTGELLRGLETRVGRVRDRIWSAARGRGEPSQRLAVAVESGLHTLIVEYAEAAAERTALAWRALPAGEQLLVEASVDLSRASRDLSQGVDRAIRDWQGGVLDLVRSEGAEKRATARFLAYGVNGLGLALMMVIFASTAGLTGAEVGVAGGTAIIGQKVLEAVFGDQAVRRLALRAHQDLHRRVDELYRGEQDRFTMMLDKHPVTPGAGERARSLGQELARLPLDERST